MSKKIIVYDRKGNEITMPSIAKTAREMKVSEHLLYNRVRDGLWIHRDGYVPVRVRIA